MGRKSQTSILTSYLESIGLLTLGVKLSSNSASHCRDSAINVGKAKSVRKPQILVYPLKKLLCSENIILTPIVGGESLSQLSISQMSIITIMSYLLKFKFFILTTPLLVALSRQWQDRTK